MRRILKILLKIFLLIRNLFIILIFNPYKIGQGFEKRSHVDRRFNFLNLNSEEGRNSRSHEEFYRFRSIIQNKGFLGRENKIEIQF